uniref:Uncharacterized protein n=1 Tax=Moniliophthora roreri TaxID=221103 RepID=A0A0W0G0R6_MONRR
MEHARTVSLTDAYHVNNLKSTPIQREHPFDHSNTN